MWWGPCYRVFGPRRLSTTHCLRVWGKAEMGRAGVGIGGLAVRAGERRASARGSERCLPLMEAQRSTPPPCPDVPLPASQNPLHCPLHCSSLATSRGTNSGPPLLFMSEHPHPPLLIFNLSKEISIKPQLQDFPGGPAVKNPPSNAGDSGSIPGQGTEIPHAAGQLSTRATTTEPELLSLGHNNRSRVPQRGSGMPQLGPEAVK